jgi:hypothetical protein
VKPVCHGGGPGNIIRKVDEIFRATVPDIEKRFLPGPDRFQTAELVQNSFLEGVRECNPRTKQTAWGAEVSYLG